MNKPCLSINDIHKKFSLSWQLDELKKVVKKKLKTDE